MIKIENTSVDGFEAALRGMRNPMNSWDKSDTKTCFQIVKGQCKHAKSQNDGCPLSRNGFGLTITCIGNNDLELMRNLVKSGPDHSKFMRMINVTCDIIAPMYWWKEFDTYKVGTVRNSCSTMHKIHEKEFTLDDFSHEHMTQHNVKLLDDIVRDLNLYRNRCLTAKDTDAMTKKDWWWQMIQLLPSSYNQRATVQLNYAVLRNMYHSRKSHKLDEWRDYCTWIEHLPYSELIVIGKD